MEMFRRGDLAQCEGSADTTSLNKPLSSCVHLIHISESDKRDGAVGNPLAFTCCVTITTSNARSPRRSLRSSLPHTQHQLARVAPEKNFVRFENCDRRATKHELELALGTCASTTHFSPKDKSEVNAK